METSNHHRFGVFPLIPLIEEVIQEKRLEFQNRIDFKFEKTHLPLSLSAQFDEKGLKRVLSNMMNNASESMQDRGEVVIALNENGSKVLITIKDHGKGIRPEILSCIRRGQFVSDKLQGNGLGISDAVKQVRSWGGELSIESEANKGTQVSISLRKDQI